MIKKILVPAIFIIVLLAILSVFGKGVIAPRRGEIEESSGGNAPTSTISPSAVESTDTSGDDSSSLTLELYEPADGETVSSSTLKVSGKTAPNVQVFVNEKELVADGNGNFSTDIEIYEGENSVFIMVNNNLGEYVEREIVVNLESVE